MRKNLLIAFCGGLITSCIFSVSAFSQTLQQFSQEDFDALMRSNPEILQQIVRSDGTIDQTQLENILRNQFDYAENPESVDPSDFSGPDARPYSERTPLEIENDVQLQRRLAEEREKAYEAYKKRMENNPPQ